MNVEKYTRDNDYQFLIENQIDLSGILFKPFIDKSYLQKDKKEIEKLGGLCNLYSLYMACSTYVENELVRTRLFSSINLVMDLWEKDLLKDEFQIELDQQFKKSLNTKSIIENNIPESVEIMVQNEKNFSSNFKSISKQKAIKIIEDPFDFEEVTLKKRLIYQEMIQEFLNSNQLKEDFKMISENIKIEKNPSYLISLRDLKTKIQTKHFDSSEVFLGPIN